MSIIFADLVGSTSLHERLDAEAVRAFMEAYYAAMRGAVEAHGGRVTQVMGDGVKAVFGVPRVAEDDAIRAVRAGVAMQQAFHALADEQRGRVGKTGLRVAVNTGEVVSDGEAEIIGDPVNVAARLQERGQDGDVVIGGSTQRIVGSLVTLDLLGSFALKGRAEQVEAYRVVSLEPPAGAKAAAFVGRGEELARLSEVYETAVEKPAAALTVLLGSPGLGKSRLIGEFVRRLGDDATVFAAHCDASGGATFAPLVAALRRRFGLDDGAGAEAIRAAVETAVSDEESEHTRIVAGVTALLSGTPASPEETFFVIRRLLAGLAAQQPVVLVIDDLQWAEPLLLDLVEHLVQWGSGVPLLVLVGGRPELRELRSSLATPGGFVSDVVTLTGLDAGAAMRLAAGVIGADDLPATLAGKLLATSEGNPLFVAELVKMLVQEGVLQREGERWVASAALASLEMPPTIHALLAARIERLSAQDRTVLERAAVVGRHFSRNAVAALLPEASDLDARLEALRRTELIERDTGWFLGEPMLRFHHVLIRDAAYRRLLKGTRAELHASLAGWIEAKAGEDPSHDETIGRHLEQAHQHRRELGPLDAEGVALGERAAQRLAAAGQRALAQDDVSLAANLLGRALACLPGEAAERAELVLDWCEALLSAGDVGPAAGAIEELGRLAAGSERLGAWHTCFAGQLTTLTAPDGLRGAADAVAEAARTLAALGDAAGEAKAHFVHAQTLARLGQVGACEGALDQALAAARRVDDRRRANAVLAGAPRAALWGPSPVTRASGRCLDVVRVLRITQGAPAVEAVALSCQGVLEALRGRTDAAKRMITSARRMVEELGIAHRLHETDVFAGRVALLEGDAPAAERHLRSAYEGLRGLGLGIDAAQAAALLARALLAQGRAAEAEALSQESEALAGDDLQAAIAWRGARAEALAERGEHEAAVALARAAVEIAAATDALLDHADARVSLAAALRAAGHSDAARAEEQRARELWETKGASLLLEGPASAPDARREADASDAPRAVRRVRRNRALETAERLDGAVASGDRARLRAPIHPECVEIHHPTGSRYGREEAIDSAERLSRSRDLVYRTDALATLGERLLLGRRRYRASGTAGGRFDVGAYTADFPIVTEVAADGRIRRNEVFAADRLGDAIARLYERHGALLPEGPARERAAGTARSVRVFEAVVDPDRVATALAPELVVDDRRGVGTETLHGADALLGSLRALMDLSKGFGCRIDDVLALSDDALLVHMTSFGTNRQSGGAYERPILELWAFDAEGRIERWERFDPGHEDEALARFDELTSRATPSGAEPHFANLASRAELRFTECFNARDWDGILGCVAERVEFDERRRLSRNRAEKAVWLEQLRVMFDLPERRFASQLLATRGERLSLHMHEFEGHVAKGGGPLAMEPHSALHEVDERRKIVAIVLFDPGDLDAAYAELDRRFEAGEGSAAAALLRGWREAFAERRWDDLRSMFAPGFVDYDRRSIALLGTRHGPESWVENVSALVDLAPDTVVRHEHLRIHRRGLLWETLWSGTREGSPFELAMVGVSEFDAGGRIVRIDFYDPEQLPEARARFEEIRAAAEGATFFENAAARTELRMTRSWAARDWEGVLAALSPALRFEDRRRMLRSEGGFDEFAAQYRLLFDQLGSRWTEPLLATRGERLSLHRVLFEAEAPEGGGPLAFDEHLALVEVDAEGRQIGVVVFDLAAEDDAYAELDGRFEAGEGGAAAADLRLFREAFASGSWDAVLARCAPDMTDHDHRRVAVFGTTRGAEAWVENFRALLRLAPDTTVRFEHVRLARRGFLWQLRFSGTREGSEYEMPMLGTIERDAEGRTWRVDTYDPEQLAEARARFAELDAPDARAALARNAAARAVERAAVAIAARDWQRFEALFSPNFRHSDRTRLAQLDSDRETWLTTFRGIVEMTSEPPRYEVLATRGERLVLARMLWEGAGGDVGPSEIEWHFIVESDECGDHIAVVNFDADDLESAYAELDARFRAGEGAAHPLATDWITRFPEAIGRRDWDALIAMSAPDLVARNHCMVSWGVLGSRDEWLPALHSMVELAPDVRLRIDHLRTSPRGLLCSLTWQGTREGGAFEISLLSVVELDAEGRQVAVDLFDTDKLDRAQARFGDIDGAGPDSPFENLASRAWRTGMDAWASRDTERVQTFHRKLRGYRDHRRLIQLDLDREGFLEFSLPLVAMATGSSQEVAATRGEQLALMRTSMTTAEGDVGESAADSLILVETDADGAVVAYDRYDLEDLDEAIAALDARAWPDDREPVGRFSRTIGSAIPDRDWDAMRRAFAPDLVGRDHRLVGWGTLLGPSAYVEAIREMVTLSPDVRVRVLHTRSSPRASLSHNVWLGTREGGVFESPFLLVIEFDTEGRAAAVDLYDPEQLDRARARYAELTPGSDASTFENFATRHMQRTVDAWTARDWDAVAALRAPGCRVEIRRRLMRVSVTGAEGLDDLRQLFDARGSRVTMTPLATRGEHLALLRIGFEGEVEGQGGPFVTELVGVIEADAECRATLAVSFDPDDLLTAYAELNARFWAEAPEGSVAAWSRDFTAALGGRDWDALRALYAPDFVGRDHRLVSWGTLRGPDQFLESVRQMIEMAPDVWMRTDHLRASSSASLNVTTWVGTRDGGAFESPFVSVGELDGDGLAARMDFYDPEQIDRALARFDEITEAGANTIAPTIATKAMDRFRAASLQGIETGDMERLRSLVTPDFAIEDRTRTAQLSGDRELMIESLRFRAASGARPTQTLFGTAGERVAIAHTLWAGGPDDGRFEVAYYAVVEVDETGVWTGCVLLDDPRAALREAWSRWAVHEPHAAELTRLLDEGFDAFEAKRRPPNLHEAFVFEDHRRTGLGRVVGPDAYAESIAAIWELAPESSAEAGRHWLAHAPGVGLTQSYHTGTLAEGGAFENTYLVLLQAEGGMLRRMEAFELEAAHEALHRFEALRAETPPDPVGASNLATVALDRWWEGLDHGAQTDDWDLLRAAGAPDLVFEDRQPFSQLAGGLELAIESIRTRVSQGANIERTLKGTLGERIAVVRVLWRGGPADARFEVEYFPVVEAEASGLLSAIILCDGARSAQREAWARWAKHEPELAAVAAPLGRLADAFNAHDRAAWRAELAEDVVVQDNRLVSMGRLEGADAWSDSVVALWELAPESTVESGWEWIAIDERGALTSILRTGTLPEGGEFESEYLLSYTVSGGKIDRVETFETHAREEALARFHARRTGPDPLVVPENAASRALAEFGARRVRGNVAEITALVTDDFEFEDRGRRSLVRGGIGEWVRSIEYLAVEAKAQPERHLVATAGDRLALHLIRWRDPADGARYEMGGYRITEVDADGNIRAFLLFDADDKAGAHGELFERFSRQPDSPPDPMSDYLRSWCAHDGAALRELLDDGFVFHDERRTGIGRVDAEGQIRSLEVLWELSADVRLDVLYVLAQRSNGLLSMVHWWGTDAEGGAFASFFAAVAETEDGRLRALWLFEPEELEAARARFDSLRTAPGGD